MRAADLSVDAATWWKWLLALAAALLLALTGAALWQYARTERALDDVEHSEAVTRAADRLLIVLTDAETGYRGYLLTSNPTFLEPYRGVDIAARDALVTLTGLLADNPQRRDDLRRLSGLVNERLAEMAQNLELFNTGRREQAFASIRAAQGKTLMDGIRQLTATLKSQERTASELRERQANSAAAAARTFAVGAVVLTLLLGLAAWSLKRSMDQRRVELAVETIGRLEAAHDAAARAAELAQSESFNRSLLDSSTDCVAVLSEHGVVTYLNQAAERHFRMTSGIHFTALWPADTGPAADALAAATAGGEGRFVTSRADADGAMLWWDVVVAPSRDAEGRVLRFVATARDVTTQRRLDEERQQLLASERAARSEAERVARLKDDFVSTLSHELRTPLNAIIGWVGVLRQDQAPETLTKAIDVIDRNSRRQSQMIDDLLDMGRILSGKMRLDVQRLELATIIEEALQSAQPSAEAKGVRLLKVLGSAAIVRGDSGRLQQVIWNLLSNAIKFTPRGGQVQVTLRKVNSQVHLQVSDTGIGIAPQHIGSIFERFRQIDGSTTRRHGGLGLGLSIVKSLVELHGGSVEVSSEGEHQGATFTVRLPLALAVPAPDTAPEERGVPAQLRASLDGLHILVVEDEDDARDIVERLLVDAGATVTPVASALQATALLSYSLRPDVILSDVGMPECDGYEFIQRVRNLPSAVHAVPAIALTALARLEDRRRALLSGFQTHLAKPVDPAELVATVATLAGRTGRSGVRVPPA